MALLAQYDSKLKELANLLQRKYAYTVNDVVYYNNVKLKCITAGTTSDKAIASSVTVGTMVTDGTVVWKVLDQNDIGILIEDWAVTTDYELKDLVIYNNIIYRCKTAHTSSSTFDLTKWDALTSDTPSSGIDTWATNKSYKKGDIVVYASQIYKCTTDHTSTSFTSDMASWELVSGVQLWKQNTFYAQNQLVYVNSDMYICMVAHTSSNDFLLDLETNYWQAVVKIDAELIPANYLQVTKIDLVDNSIVDIKIPKTLTFCVKPPMVLKFNPSADIETITQNEFDSSDKDDFEYNKNYVIFDGTMHIKSDLGVNTSTPEKLIDGYVSISDTINFAEYKSVSGVKVG